MSFMTVFQSSRPDASLWTTTTVQFTLPYFTISISLNIILTLLLVALQGSGLILLSGGKTGSKLIIDLLLNRILLLLLFQMLTGILLLSFLKRVIPHLQVILMSLLMMPLNLPTLPLTPPPLTSLSLKPLSVPTLL